MSSSLKKVKNVFFSQTKKISSLPIKITRQFEGVKKVAKKFKKAVKKVS